MTTITGVQPKTWREMLAAGEKAFAEARAILVDPDRAGEKDKVEELMEAGRDYKQKAATLQSIKTEADAISDALAEATDDHVEDDGVTHGQRQQKASYNSRPTGTGFKNWGDFLSAVYTAQAVPNGPWDPRLNFVKYDDNTENVVRNEKQSIKDMAEAVGASGGFLVPTEFQNELQAVMGETASIRPRCTIIRMARRAIRIPVLDQTGTTAGAPHWFGGMTFTWAEEAAQKDQSDPNFRQIELVAHKLIGYTRASDELVQDSAISLDDFLSGPMGFAGGAVWEEEFAFLQGTGAGQPLGIINAGATIVEPRNTANTVVFDDFADMVKDFLPSGRGVWMISQSAMSDIIQLNGPTGNPSYIWQANARDGIPGQILGMPVIWTEKCPILGQTGDVCLADWSYYLIGDRQATTVESTKFDRWRYDQTSWRMTHRVDGQPWLSSPLTYQDGTTQVSPFVILDATAGGS
jgi:HK97 family phage major capsid protein